MRKTSARQAPPYQSHGGHFAPAISGQEQDDHHKDFWVRINSRFLMLSLVENMRKIFGIDKDRHLQTCNSFANGRVI
jgi:hypothetical protein